MNKLSDTINNLKGWLSNSKTYYPIETLDNYLDIEDVEMLINTIEQLQKEVELWKTNYHVKESVAIELSAQLLATEQKLEAMYRMSLLQNDEEEDKLKGMSNMSLKEKADLVEQLTGEIVIEAKSDAFENESESNKRIAGLFRTFSSQYIGNAKSINRFIKQSD